MSGIRDDLSSAFEEQTSTLDTATVEAPVEASTAAADVDGADASPGESSAERAARERDEAGRFAKKSETKPAVKPTPSKAPAASPQATGTPPPASTPAQAPPVATSPPAAEAVKAPQSWKPAAREHFGTLPPEVQQEVVRRERETAVALQAASAHRQQAEAFQKTVEPYRALLTDEPMKVVGSLLQTAAQLQTAPPAHKAQLVATIIRQYGVDIHALDEALAGAQSAAGQGGAQPHAAVDPNAIAARVRQELLQGFQQQRQVAAQQKSAQEVEAFSTQAEFLDDVREDMADMMEMASRRGVELSLEAAYTRACKMHPEISQVLQQREAAKAATATQAATQRARTASSSVRSQPTASAPAATDDSIRATLLASIAANQRR